MPLADMIAAAFVLAVLVAAAITDVRSRIIPNVLPAMLVGGFLLYAAFAPGIQDIVFFRISAAALAFVFGLAMFTAGVFGGGDVKLLSALILWLPLDQIGPFLFAVGVAGAIVSAGYAAKEFFVIQAAADGRQSMRTGVRLALQTKVPYGVAILLAYVAANYVIQR